MSRVSTGHSGRRGYTLIELVIVVALLGLAGALVVPHAIGLSTMETQSAVRRLVADIHYAQSEAISHQAYRRVQFFDDGRGYCLLAIDDGTFASPFDESTATYLEDPAGTFGMWGRYVVDYGADARYGDVQIGEVDTDGDGRWLTFDALGGIVVEPGVAAGAGRIVIEGTDEQWEVLVTPMTGRLVVQRLSL